MLGASSGVWASGILGATAPSQHSAKGVRSPPTARGVRQARFVACNAETLRPHGDTAAGGNGGNRTRDQALARKVGKHSRERTG